MNKSFLTFLTLLFYTFLWSQEKPNFVLIVADDLGYGDLGVTGSSQIATPHIDRLASEGVFFERGYVSGAVCAPSRAGLMTGINQVEFGFATNLTRQPQPGYTIDSMGLPLSQKIIPQYLKPHGYVSGIIGKWHLGYQDYFSPTARGFDEFWGYRSGGHDYFRSDESKGGYLAPIECNYKTPDALTYITDDKGDECVDFINRHKDQPFFLYASFNAPHTPMQATEEDLKLYEHIEDEKRRTYAAMVHRLDVNVGKIVATVESLGLLENTIFVFISDNGGPVSVNSSINAPYRGMKGMSLDGGIHVPFLMSWKNHLPEGLRYPHLVTALDLAPTFLALASGAESPENQFTGVNLYPYLTENSDDKPHDTLFIRTEVSSAIITENYKLITFPDRFPELYDLSRDVSEVNNLTADYQSIAQSLLKALGQWKLKLPHPYFQVAPFWQSYNLKLYDNMYPLVQPR